MNFKLHAFLLLVYWGGTFMCSNTFNVFNDVKFPTVGVTVLARNKASTLPQFLTSLLDLDYPKDRMFIWFRTDYNNDNTIEILNEFVKRFGALYNKVHLSCDQSMPRHDNQFAAAHWAYNKHAHIIRWRESGLKFAKHRWADYIFMLDADVFFTNRQVLRQLISKGVNAVAPMLVSDLYYSNFWLGMSGDYLYNYEADDEYYHVYYRRDRYTGCHPVPLAFGAVLIDLRSKHTDKLTYDPNKVLGYTGPPQDYIVFAASAMHINVTLILCNEEFYGYINQPAGEDEPQSVEDSRMTNIKLMAIARTTPIETHYKLQQYVQYPALDNYGVDRIYMINLARRPDKRRLMELSFKELGMNVTRSEAVDGRRLNEDNIRALNVTLMPGYEDPYHKRPMTFGEIGCFLSHYSIWLEMLEKRYKTIIIFEDDIYFLPDFQSNYYRIVEESASLAYDFLYLGRKVLSSQEEIQVTSHLTKPVYSYWTIGYILTASGARKLVEAKPLSALLPIDEFLPIMFDQHPNDKYKAFFPRRTLKALSANPTIIEPTHYTGMPGYISDTEDSETLVEQQFFEVPKEDGKEQGYKYYHNTEL